MIFRFRFQTSLPHLWCSSESIPSLDLTSWPLKFVVTNYAIPGSTFSSVVRSGLPLTPVGLLLSSYPLFSLRPLVFVTLSLFRTESIRIITWLVSTPFLEARTLIQLPLTFDFPFFFFCLVLWLLTLCWWRPHCMCIAPVTFLLFSFLVFFVNLVITNYSLWFGV